MVVKIRNVRADIFVGILAVVMAALGGAVSALSLPDNLEKTVSVGLFVVLGALACITIAVQSVNAKASEEYLRGQLEKLESATGEIIGLQRENKDLQRKVVALAEENATLTKRNLDSVTGGDGFCYMVVNHQFGYPLPTFLHRGEYTLYDVRVTVVDVNRLNAGIQPNVVLNVSIGEIHPSMSHVNPQLRLPDSISPNQAFNVFFTARNGRWNQLLRLRMVNCGWTTAMQVWRVEGPVPPEKPTYEEISSDFPKGIGGKIDWE